MNREHAHLEQLFTEAEGAPLSPRELRQYRLLAELLSGWRVLGEGSLAALSGEISARIREDAEARASARVDQTIDPSIPVKSIAADAAIVRDFRAVDDLLQSVAAPMPPVDWKAFSTQVSSAVRREAKVVHRHRRLIQRRYLNWVVRAAIPLAAAAVLAIALWPAKPTSTPVAKGPAAEPKPMIFVSLEQPRASSGKVSVTFDEAKPQPAGNESPVPVTAIAIGPPRMEAVEIPIDPALLP